MHSLSKAKTADFLYKIKPQKPTLRLKTLLIFKLQQVEQRTTQPNVYRLHLRRSATQHNALPTVPVPITKQQ